MISACTIKPAWQCVVVASEHDARRNEIQTSTKMIAAAPIEIALGTARYAVGIDSSKNWKSGDGETEREYLNIGKPGISPVAKAYVVVSGATGARSSDSVVATERGVVVWTPAAGGLSSAKHAAVTEWFISVLKNS